MDLHPIVVISVVIYIALALYIIAWGVKVIW